jgi:UPF0716 protein FxsA
VPAAELLDGLLIVIAGVLLISPGMLTDVVGLTLLLPPVRRLVRCRLSQRIRARMVKIVSAMGPQVDAEDELDEGTVVDAESRPSRP